MRQGVHRPETPRDRAERAGLEEDLQENPVSGAPVRRRLRTFRPDASAQLAASHPVSGGTYEYGYRYLGPSLGFVAGWMFLCAKSASAATASPSLRTSTHSSGSSGLALISWCGTNGGT